MNNNESSTKNTAKKDENKSMTIEKNEIHTEGLQVLSRLSELDDSTPESSLITQAQRLNNVAHSFIEQREKAYLNDELEKLAVNPSDFSIDAVCKLSEQARLNIKLATEIRNDKVKNFKTIVDAMRGK